ncbi:MAG TPA: S46 family peptidase, partial [Steroidobacteraceae bacterium]|nr:S46 family peptidase [Steroidobacteraceae bacterium]
MLIAALVLGVPAWGDEGMWTFQNFPSDVVRQKYGVNISREWLERVQTAIIRLADCTASFVSSDGLLLTNHHCAEACLAQHSSPSDDLLERGFMAGDRPRELRCGTQIADVLLEMEDVTPQVRQAEGTLSAQAALEARKRTLTRLEQACEDASRRNRRTGPLKC